MDLSYTLGLDGSGFAATASRVLSTMGSMELAVQGIQRAASALSSAFNLAADMEKTTTAIGTVTKSAETTKRVMADLKALASSTPFEMSDLAPAARALLGAGTAAKDVSNQLRVLGDVSSAANTDLGGLVSVFNQVRGKGKLTAEEFQQFAERGVAGLREEIAKFKGIQLEGVGDALSKGAVSAKDLEAVFMRMTGAGGIAFQAMERQSETFAGKLSTLADGWAALQVAFAQPINDALKPIIDDMAGLMGTLEPVFGLIGQQVAVVVTAAREFFGQLSAGENMVTALVSSFGELAGTVAEFASIPFGALGDALPSLVAAFMTAVGPLSEYMALKFEVVAVRFASRLQSKAAEALRAIDEFLPTSFGFLGAAANAADRGAMGSAMEGMKLNDQAQALDLTATLQPAQDTLNESMQSFIDGLTSRFDAFTSALGLAETASAGSSNNDTLTGGYVGGSPGNTTMAGILAESANAGEIIAESFIDRLASASALPIATSSTTTGQAAPASTPGAEAMNQKLEAILGELQKINVQ